MKVVVLASQNKIAAISRALALVKENRDVEVLVGSGASIEGAGIGALRALLRAADERCPGTSQEPCHVVTDSLSLLLVDTDLWLQEGGKLILHLLLRDKPELLQLQLVECFTQHKGRRTRVEITLLPKRSKLKTGRASTESVARDLAHRLLSPCSSSIPALLELPDLATAVEGEDGQEAEEIWLLIKPEVQEMEYPNMKAILAVKGLMRPPALDVMVGSPLPVYATFGEGHLQALLEASKQYSAPFCLLVESSVCLETGEPACSALPYVLMEDCLRPGCFVVTRLLMRREDLSPGIAPDRPPAELDGRMAAVMRYGPRDVVPPAGDSKDYYSIGDFTLPQQQQQRGAGLPSAAQQAVAVTAGARPADGAAAAPPAECSMLCQAAGQQGRRSRKQARPQRCHPDGRPVVVLSKPEGAQGATEPAETSSPAAAAPATVSAAPAAGQLPPMAVAASGGVAPPLGAQQVQQGRQQAQGEVVMAGPVPGEGNKGQPGSGMEPRESVQCSGKRTPEELLVDLTPQSAAKRARVLAQEGEPAGPSTAAKSLESQVPSSVKKKRKQQRRQKAVCEALVPARAAPAPVAAAAETAMSPLAPAAAPKMASAGIGQPSIPMAKVTTGEQQQQQAQPSLLPPTLAAAPATQAVPYEHGVLMADLHSSRRARLRQKSMVQVQGLAGPVQRVLYRAKGRHSEVLVKATAILQGLGWGTGRVEKHHAIWLRGVVNLDPLKYYLSRGSDAPLVLMSQGEVAAAVQRLRSGNPNRIVSPALQSNRTPITAAAAAAWLEEFAAGVWPPCNTMPPAPMTLEARISQHSRPEEWASSSAEQQEQQGQQQRQGKPGQAGELSLPVKPTAGQLGAPAAAAASPGEGSVSVQLGQREQRPLASGQHAAAVADGARGQGSRGRSDSAKPGSGEKRGRKTGRADPQGDGSAVFKWCMTAVGPAGSTGAAAGAEGAHNLGPAAPSGAARAEQQLPTLAPQGQERAVGLWAANSAEQQEEQQAPNQQQREQQQQEWRSVRSQELPMPSTSAAGQLLSGDPSASEPQAHRPLDSGPGQRGKQLAATAEGAAAVEGTAQGQGNGGQDGGVEPSRNKQRKHKRPKEAAQGAGGGGKNRAKTAVGPGAPTGSAAAAGVEGTSELYPTAPSAAVCSQEQQLPTLPKQAQQQACARRSRPTLADGAGQRMLLAALAASLPSRAQPTAPGRLVQQRSPAAAVMKKEGSQGTGPAPPSGYEEGEPFLPPAPPHRQPAEREGERGRKGRHHHAHAKRSRQHAGTQSRHSLELQLQQQQCAARLVSQSYQQGALLGAAGQAPKILPPLR